MRLVVRELEQRVLGLEDEHRGSAHFLFFLSNDRALETLQGQRKNGNGVSTFHMKKAKCEIYPLLSVMSL